MHYLLAVVGAVLGGMLGADSGVLIGALAGLGAGLIWRQQQAIRSLEARLGALESSLPPARESSPDVAAPPAAVETVVPQATATAPAPEPSATSAPASKPQPPEAPEEWPRPVPRPVPREPGAFEKRFDALISGLVRFATTGNPVVRIGAVVLFIGVAYLLRFAYEHELLPVELRLSGAALGGMVLLGFGWRLRDRSDTYGLILQGVGLAILYLTVFASSRLYELLPLSAALVVLVCLVAGASVLAVLQQSQALAIFATSGGFLAPVLTSTGQGSHVALFSYYALLNAGILGMAWFRRWRWLNWTGFVFTFVIGGLWGYRYYKPEYFASTEPFLLLFFAFYLAVSVLFARRHTVELKGLVDGTLVFGTPVVAFALQAALVQDKPFGLAYSAFGAAAIYTGLALWLRRDGRISSLLPQSFVALAAVFVTLAIPFAFDNQRFTAATWALEGAGIYWAGLRQAQRLPRAFGLLLQAAAGAAFISEFGRAADATLFLNSAYMGAAFLGIAALAIAAFIGRNPTAVHRFELPARWLLMIWGVFWWLLGGLRELAGYTPGEPRFTATNIGEHLYLIYVAASVALLIVVANRLRWRDGLLPGFVLLPIAVATLFALDIGWERATVLSDYGWLAWPVVGVTFLWHLRQVDRPGRVTTLWHAGGWWFLTLLLTWNGAALVDARLPESVWTYCLWGGVPLAACAAMFAARFVERWPFGPFRDAYFGWGWMVGLGYLLAWLLVTGFVPGDPQPLPYVVLINPLELIQLAVLLLGAFWVVRVDPRASRQLRLGTAAVIAGVAFIWSNFVALRAVHFYAGAPYPVERIAESDAFQSTATILWTTIALILMGVGGRRRVRLPWLLGAGLLAVVIAKLFLVDMGRLDLIARIVSFITVGVLMLVIGYFAPIPPRRVEESQA